MTTPAWRIRDNLAAKLRMRRLRSGGTTVWDRARNHAIRKLIFEHRSEFDEYRRTYIQRYLREVNK